MADPLPPTEELAELVRTGDAPRLERFLDALDPAARALALSRLSDEERERLLVTVRHEDAAELLEQLPESQAIDALEALPPEDAARIVEELPSDLQADVIGELESREAEAILSEMEPAEAREVRLLAAYEDDEAGGLMVTEYLEFPVDAKVGDVIDDLQANAERYREYVAQYAYVVDPEERLVGVLFLRELLFSQRSRPIRALMIASPLSVRDTTKLPELDDFFDEHPLVGAPVVDADGRLIGVVLRSAVEEALAEESDNLYLSSQGILGGDELRTMPLLLRSRRRLSWLSINILLNVLAASVIAAHQDVLASAIALAVFLPILSDMSGCSGNQAVAVSMRELALGLVLPSEVRRVLGKELAVGLINGAVLGLLLGLAAWLWKGNPWLGGVVGLALLLNTVVAVAIGGSVPLLLKRMKLDPALASGPILTTVTDMCGFFLVLTFAQAVLTRIAG